MKLAIDVVLSATPSLACYTATYKVSIPHLRAFHYLQGIQIWNIWNNKALDYEIVQINKNASCTLINSISLCNGKYK